MATPNVPVGQNPQNMSYIYQFAYPGYSIYVSNMDRQLTEPLMYWLLQQFFPNQVLACKFFEEVGGSEPYCFVMFTHPCVASAALNILNGRHIFDKKIRVNWACPPNSQTKVGGPEPEGHAIYVGDLSSDIDDRMLQEAFKTFGNVQAARVVRDAESSLSKGYGFVVFSKLADAEQAMNRMNGNILGGRPIKVSWATRKSSGIAPPPLNYPDVYGQSSEANTTIYVGGLPESWDDARCREFFEPYGILRDCKYYPDKRYAFVTFDTHEGAATAIVRTNGQMVEGTLIKCWWSKENTQMPPSMPGGPPQQIMPPAPGYPPQYPPQQTYY